MIHVTCQLEYKSESLIIYCDDINRSAAPPPDEGLTLSTYTCRSEGSQRAYVPLVKVLSLLMTCSVILMNWFLQPNLVQRT